MAIDLTAAAGANGSARRAASAVLIASDSSGRLADLSELAAASAFGTNVHAAKVQAYDRAEEILVSTVNPTDVWRPRREAFEAICDHGHRFVYGAVNAGGMGVEGFGVFCLVVVDPEAPAPDALAVFPGDSAQRYTTVAAAVDIDQLVSEVTAWADRADLAVVEKGGAALAGAADGWPEVLCSDDGYLEVVRAGRLPTSALSEVRMRRGYQDRLDDLQLRDLEHEMLRPDEANELAAYLAIQDWSRALGVTIIDIP